MEISNWISVGSCIVALFALNFSRKSARSAGISASAAERAIELGEKDSRERKLNSIFRSASAAWSNGGTPVKTLAVEWSDLKEYGLSEEDLFALCIKIIIKHKPNLELKDAENQAISFVKQILDSHETNIQTHLKR